MGVLAALVVSGVAMTSVLGPAGAGNGGPGVARGTQPARAYDSALAVAARAAHNTASSTSSAPASTITITSFSPDSGPGTGGTVISVTGSGFDGPVGFEGFLFGPDNPDEGAQGVTDTSLTVTSPPGTGTVPISIDTLQGIIPTSFTFTYAPLPSTTTVPPATMATLCPTPVPIAKPTDDPLKAAGIDILNRINLERAQRCPLLVNDSSGTSWLPQLTWNDTLGTCGMQWAAEEAVNGVSDPPSSWTCGAGSDLAWGGE